MALSLDGEEKKSRILEDDIPYEVIQGITSAVAVFTDIMKYRLLIGIIHLGFMLRTCKKRKRTGICL